MKVEALRSFMSGGEVVKVGEILEVSPTDANDLIYMGKAKEAVICEVQTEPKAKAKKATPKPKKPTNPPIEELEE